jgi:hypothetical protein
MGNLGWIALKIWDILKAASRYKFGYLPELQATVQALITSPTDQVCDMHPPGR